MIFIITLDDMEITRIRVAVFFVVVTLLTLYFTFNGDDYHRMPVLHSSFHNPFERGVIEMTEDQDWIRVRNIRNYCNGAYTSDIKRVNFNI